MHSEKILRSDYVYSVNKIVQAFKKILSGKISGFLQFPFPILSIVIFSTQAFSQAPPPTKIDTSTIEIKSADYLEIIQRKNVSFNRLVNHVVLVQKDLTLYCDSALLFKSQNLVKVYGHVHFDQADSVQAYGDSAIYDGNTKMARLFQHVKLTDRSMTLTTDQLAYNLNTKIATYAGGGTLTDGEAVLTSETGYYYAETNDAFFKRNVKLTHPDYGLEADTLQYNTASETAYFHGPTNIFNKESTVYCEHGYYRTNSGIAVFHNNVKMHNPPQELSADSIYYNRETGIGKAYRHIIFTDTARNILQYSNIAEYDEIHNTILSTSGSVAGYIIEQDTLFIGGDTIRTIQDSLKRRTMFVYHNVRIFKSDIQGRCDSLSYTDMDSVLRMYGMPVMWSDSTQFTADTINMIMRNGDLEEIQLFSNGFIINEDDSLIYNQIKGRVIYGYFIDRELRRIKAVGNGESIYFGKDDAGGYIGVNKMECSEIYIYLNNKKFHRITFKNIPTSEFMPMPSVNVKDFQLKDFKWEYDKRPASLDELLQPANQQGSQENPSDVRSLQKDG